MSNDLSVSVESAIRGKKLFRDGQKILVAVSGGLDSMVLLHLLQRLAAAHRWNITVAHFNHQLRGRAADADERLVAKTAKGLALPFVVGRRDVKSFAQRAGLSLEMAGRKLRHEFLAKVAARRKIPSMALAHHADDQVELFFLRLLRGAGNEGLAGMKWNGASPFARSIRLARPLLDQPKAELESFARENGIAFAVDASNAGLDIQRNRLRAELLPLLRAWYQPALERTILRCMELARAESDFVAETARHWLARPGKKSFAGLAVAVQRGVLQRQLFKLNVAGDFNLIEFLRTHPNEAATLNPTQTITRGLDGRICLRKAATTAFKTEFVALNLPRRSGVVDFGGLKISWQLADLPGMKFSPQTNREHFDASKVGSKIRLRHWQPGDRFQPIGASAPVKLQDIFTNLKVPKEERHRRVVAVAASGDIFWAEGVRIGEGFKLAETTSRRLEWSWRRPSPVPS